MSRPPSEAPPRSRWRSSNGSGPASGGGPSRGCRDGRRDGPEHNGLVEPEEVEGFVRQLSTGDLLGLLEPHRDCLNFLAGETVQGWWACPECQQRHVQVSNSVIAWCATCRGRWTRWSLIDLVLRSPLAVELVAARLSRRKGA